MSTWTRFCRSRRAVGGAIVLGLFILAALLAAWIAPTSPIDTHPVARLLPPFSPMADIRPFFGTDQLGRDIFTRVLYGGRVSLSIAALSALVGGSVGVTAGLIAGYYRGIVDTALMRLADIQLAIPPILLAIAIAAILGPGVRNLVVTLSISSWIVFARVVRSGVLEVAATPYVEAARSVGAPDYLILWRHVLRNVISPVIVIATQQFALMMLLEASLSFLGVGLPAEIPTWGRMIAEGRTYMLSHAWWLVVFPGGAISLTVLAANFFGDGLQDVLNPKTRL